MRLPHLPPVLLLASRVGASVLAGLRMSKSPPLTTTVATNLRPPQNVLRARGQPASRR